MIKRLAFLDVRIMIAVPSVFNRLADLVPAKTVWTYRLKIQFDTAQFKYAACF